MKKRILSGAAALAMVLTVSAAPAFAADKPNVSVDVIELPIVNPNDGDTYSGICGENVTWSLTTADGTLTISGTGAMYDYTSTDDGNDAPWYDAYRIKVKHVIVKSGVTSVGNAAFHDCINMEDFTAENGVASIGSTAFLNCMNLASVTLPESTVSIGEKAFAGCESIKTVALPAGVTSLGDMAFSGCTGLKSVDIPAGVTAIPMSAFYRCTALENVTIPDGVTSIGISAFAKCSKLKKVTVPASVTSIGTFALGYINASSISPSKVEDFVIAGYEGSAAETYASANSFTFEKLGSVSAKVRGDANRDGVLTPADLGLMQQKAAGWTVDLDLEAADITGDNEVDGADIAILQKHFGGWDVDI